MSEGNSPISSSDTATAWLAPKGEEIDLNGVSVQVSHIVWNTRRTLNGLTATTC